MSHASAKNRPAHRRVKKPRKQLFIVFGEKALHVPTPPWLLITFGVALTGLMAWYFAATAYIIFRDDVLAATIARQARMQHAYEDRISALRLQVDKVTSRQLLDQEAFVARLDKVMERQQVLEQRAIGVNALLEQTRGGAAPQKTSEYTPAPQDDVTGAIEEMNPIEKKLSELRDGKTNARAARAVLHKGAIPQQIAQFEGALHGLGNKQQDVVSKIESNAAAHERRIRLVLNELGVRAPRTATLENTIQFTPNASAVGGPYIPDHSASDEFFQKLARAKTALNNVKQLETTITTLPLRRPVFGAFEITSIYGSRSDPFLGSSAFHAGIDVRGPMGQPIYATGAGIVSSAGNNGGYGNVVEIDHGEGLATRYGHMSEILVKEGQQITAGTLIGRVGSTGRSTGPHLHYETRVNDEAVDPMKFVKAGMRLGKF